MFLPWRNVAFGGILVTVFQLYQYDGMETMKECMQCNPVISWKDSRLQRVSNLGLLKQQASDLPTGLRGSQKFMKPIYCISINELPIFLVDRKPGNRSPCFHALNCMQIINHVTLAPALADDIICRDYL